MLISYRMNAGTLPADSWIHGSEGGGRIIGEACHIFDLFNFLVGATPVEVVALPLNSSTSHISITDNFTASVRYSDGSLCTLTYTSLGSSDLPKEYMEMFFDGKTIVLDDYRKLTYFGISAKPQSKSQQDKGHMDELRQLSEYLLGRGPVPMSLDEIEAATRISFVVDQLVRNGGTSS
jgi:predicted dehydrogenase